MDKLALIAGNVFLGLAALLYVVPYQLVLAEKPHHDGGVLWAYLFLSLPFFILFSLAYSVVVWRGGLDAWGWDRTAQYAFVWGVCLALLAASFCSGVFRYEPAASVPWMVRPILGWAAYLIPLLLLVIAVLLLNGMGPVGVVRKAFGALGACGVVMGVLLAGEVFWAILRNQEQQVAARIAYDNRRDQMMLAEVERADALGDFGSLLPHTSKWEDPRIREIALRKVRSVPDLQTALRTHLRNGYYADALTFLRDNDVPERAPLAEAVRDAIGRSTAHLRRRVDANRDLWREDLASEVSRVQEVAAKYGRYGVDLNPAVQEYEGLAAQARKLAR